MDTLFTILFFVAAAVLSAIMKKKQAVEEERDFWTDENPPGAPREKGTTTDRPKSWEEELRRLLQGQPPVAPMPPVAREVRPAPPSPPPLPEAQMEIFGGPTVTSSRLVPPKKPRFKEARQSYERARTLEATARARMEAASHGITVHKKTVEIKKERLEFTQALNLLKSPQNLRSAMIASIILGPPKSMERES